MIRAVLFDLDGVVRHFDSAAVADIEQRAGVDPGALTRAALSTAALDQVTTGRISRQEWIGQIAVDVANEAAAEEWGRQRPTVDQAVVTLANELAHLGLTTAILTNGTDTIPEEMVAAGLTAHFDPIFNSAAIGHAKPDQRAFQHALDVLGLPAGQVFFTDDSPAKPTGAEALGIRTHHFVGIAELRGALRAHGIAVG
ncbi:HAD family hydrolase [Microbacterium sp. A94]|uniref:HAD family hydrolase n=1 Tax=Microbacterium sp. A94 TaxID=3450717 RepID=UPI003F4315B2